MKKLFKKDNIPFWPCEETAILRVDEGIINLYYTCVDTVTADLTGTRIFLLQIQEGELIFPLPFIHRESGDWAGLLAVPMRDSSLSVVKADSLFTQELAPACGEWVEHCCARLGLDRIQTEMIVTGLDQQSLEGFNADLLAKFDQCVTDEARFNATANQRRYVNEDMYFQSAMKHLERVVPGKKEPEEDASTIGAAHSPLLQACSLVAASQKMKLTLSESILQGKFSSNPVGDIAAASHFRTRDIILNEEWYKQNGGSLLAWRKDGADNNPVALIQTRPGLYILEDPTTGERCKVTQEIAEQFEPRSVMFYRNLPMKALQAKDIFTFVLQGTDKIDWIWVAIMGVCGGLLGMLTPQITGKVFDTVIPDGNRSLLMQIGFLMLAMALTTFAFELTRSFAMQRISGHSERDLQSAVWDRMLSLPVNFFRDYSAGELAQRAMSISQIRSIISGSVINTMISSIFSVFYLVVIFNKSAKLAWIGVSILAVTLLISLGLGYLQIKYENTLIDLTNHISGRLFGWLSGLAKIKMAGAERRIFYNWAMLFGRTRKLTFRKESIGNYLLAFNSIVTLASSIIIYLAMYKLKDGMIAIGAFIAFNAAFQKLMGSCMEISRMIMDVNVIIPLYEKVKPIFSAVPEYDEQKNDPGSLMGDIELSHVNFRYHPGGPLVIKDVSLRVRPGEHVALVGPSGSGKSTLFRILLAFEKPESGEIYFDGMSLDQLDIRQVRRQLGVVLQSGQLLAGSIFDNVVGAHPELTTEDAMRAIRQAGMEEDLKQMPMGLHTAVSEGAGTLSGGQRQRLLIARALVSNPKILFFDEATSALDNQTQKVVSESINSLHATRITIAHRLSTIRDCDRIVVLENGAITEEGTYDALIALNGTFAMMAKRQGI